MNFVDGVAGRGGKFFCKCRRENKIPLCRPVGIPGATRGPLCSAAAQLSWPGCLGIRARQELLRPATSFTRRWQGFQTEVAYHPVTIFRCRAIAVFRRLGHQPVDQGLGQPETVARVELHHLMPVHRCRDGISRMLTTKSVADPACNSAARCIIRPRRGPCCVRTLPSLVCSGFRQAAGKFNISPEAEPSLP